MSILFICIFLYVLYIQNCIYILKEKKNYTLFGIIFKENIFKNYIIVITLIVTSTLPINWSKDGLNLFE